MHLLVRKLSLSSLLIIIFAAPGISQIIGSTDPCDTGSEDTCTCDSAPVVCPINELDGFTYSMSSYLHPDDGPDPMCDGPEGVSTVSNNPTWFAFISWCEDLTIEVIYDNCTEIGFGTFGLQVAVYEDCSLDPSSAIECDTDISGCVDDSSRVLDLTDLEIGKTYYFLVDGCAGSACDVEISVISDCGVNSLEEFDQEIQGPTEFCYSGSPTTYSIDEHPGAINYFWYLDGVEVASGQDLLSHDFDLSTNGVYQICVDVDNEPCYSVEDGIEPLCIEVTVGTDAGAGIISLNQSPSCPGEEITFTVSDNELSSDYSQWIILADASGVILYTVSGTLGMYTSPTCANYTVYSYNYYNLSGTYTTPVVGDNINDFEDCPSSLTTEMCNCELVAVDVDWEDTEAPVFTNPPADITVSCIDELPILQDLDYTDNCLGDGSTQGTDTGSADTCLGGTYTRTWSVTDDCGNEGMHTQIITVDPAPVPVFTSIPDDENLSCADLLDGEVSVDYTNNSVGACLIEGSVIGVGDVSPDICGGDVTYTWTTQDACGNDVVATQLVTIDPPLDVEFLNVPADVTITCDQLPFVPVSLDYTNNDIGGCLIEGTEDTPEIDGDLLTCADVITITWEVTDFCGRVFETTQMVTLENTEAPTFDSSPIDLTYACYLDVPAIEDLTWTDDCDGTGTVSGVETGSISDCFGGTLTRTWTYTDLCNNTVTHVQTLTVLPIPDLNWLSSLPSSINIECGEPLPQIDDLNYSNAPAGISCLESGTVPGILIGTLSEIGDQITIIWEVSNPLCGPNLSHIQVITLVSGDIEEIPYNDIDDDCDPSTPDDDLDGDGFGILVDCDDTNPDINPGMTEIQGNGIDDDCNPNTPDGEDGPDDLDDDGYDSTIDCDDTNPEINPGMTEVPYNGLDDDCNPETLDDDLDGDGYGVAEDCNDNNVDINPGTIEIYNNGIDENCDGVDFVECRNVSASCNPFDLDYGNVLTFSTDFNPEDYCAESVDYTDGSIWYGFVADNTTESLSLTVDEILDEGCADSPCQEIYIAIYESCYVNSCFDNSIFCDSRLVESTGETFVFEVSDLEIFNDYYVVITGYGEGSISYTVELNGGLSVDLPVLDSIYVSNARKDSMCANVSVRFRTDSYEILKYRYTRYLLDSPNGAVINSSSSFSLSFTPGVVYGIGSHPYQRMCYQGFTDCDSTNLVCLDYVVTEPTNAFDFDNDGYDSSVDCDDCNPYAYPGQTEIPYNNIDEDCVPETEATGLYCIAQTDCQPDREFKVVSRSLDPDGTSGLSLDGPFCGGESVQICIEYQHIWWGDFANGDLHGIVPIFGNGWDLDSFDPTAVTVGYDEDQFQWFDEGVVETNVPIEALCTSEDADGRLVLCNSWCQDCQDCDQGVEEGHGLPGGWFYVSDEESEDCLNNGNPNESSGYAGSCISFCIDLTVKEYASEEEWGSANDLSFGFQPFEDGVTGCSRWPSYDISCTLLEPQIQTYASVRCEDDDLDDDGFIAVLDCDDNDPNVNPGATEIPYNGIDDDCDPLTLDDDLDQDGFTLSEDCDDTDSQVYVGANCDDGDICTIDDAYSDDCNCIGILQDSDEDGICDSNDLTDGDCMLGESCDDGDVCTVQDKYDENCNCLGEYRDSDEDGVCNAEDCKPFNANVYPGNTETPYNGLDDDCDPETLDDDLDSDSYDLAEDCDDLDPLINPGAEEILGNAIDEDCDGEIIALVDADMDGYFDDVDCDDTNPNIYPGATEFCNDLDDNCDGTIDNDAINQILSFADIDGDGFGDPDNAFSGCFVPNNFVQNTLDCNDANPSVNPSAEETPYNGIDDDCNIATPDDDLDNDGFAFADDCDDSNNLIYPGASCDDGDDCTIDDKYGANCLCAGIFEDTDEDGICDAEDLTNGDCTLGSSCDDGDDCTENDIYDADCGCSGELLPSYEYFIDTDGDSFGSDEASITECTEMIPDGYADNNLDCDDTNPNINPDAEDIPNNGIDEDCDGEDFLSSTYELNGEQIDIYPNPVSEILQVNTTTEKVYTLQLFDTNGRLITEKSTGSTIDCTHLDEGMYLIKVIDSQSGDFVVERVVVSH